MVELLEIDSFHLFKQIVSRLCAFLTGEANDEITDVNLVESVEFLNAFLHAHAVETQHVALGIGSILFFNLTNAVEGRVLC